MEAKNTVNARAEAEGQAFHRMREASLSMAKRTKKRKRKLRADLRQTALTIVEKATGGGLAVSSGSRRK